MNDAARPGTTGQAIELAGEPDFEIGALQVSPALRTLRTPDRQELTEPRAMQVLVALVRARGAVVSRDALIERCWGGRIVGDDAINSCIAKVRALASLAEPPAFEIETIPRVGYRLKKPSQKPVSAPSSAGLLSGTRVPTAIATDMSVLPSRRMRWKAMGTGISALLAGGAIVGGVWLFRPASLAQWTVARSEVLIADSLIDMYPAISRDGAMISWSAGKNKVGRQIYLRRISGGDPLRLTDDSYDDTSPSWSPDGSQIAYVAYKEGEPCRLMVTPVPAGPPRELARCQIDERTRISWSSGGELYFVDKPDRRSTDRIMRFDPATSHRKQLTEPAAGSFGEDEPTASPDGHWISFRRHTSDLIAQQVVRDLRTGAERAFTSNANLYDAAWSEDSQTLFVDTQKGRDFALWAWAIGSGSQSRILSSPVVMQRLSSGPHGLLAVEILRGYAGLARPPTSADGGPSFLSPERGQDFSADIARDGTIALMADRPGGTGLWVMPKGGVFRKLISIDAQSTEFSDPRWSPDGSRIAYAVQADGAFGIHIVTAEGAEVAAVVFRGSSIGAPAWSADGRALIFPGRDARGWRLWHVDLAHTGDIKPFPGTGWQDIRTRNNEVYGIRDDGPGVWRIDGIPRRITPKPDSHDPDWTIAGDEIAYIDEPYGERKQVLARPIGGGSIRVMAEVPKFCCHGRFAVDPTSGTVIYEAALAQEDDIELLHLARK